MKIAPAQINGFLAKPPPQIRLILIYGPDQGLVRERADMLAKKLVPDLNDPFRVTHLGSTDLHESPARLQDEAATDAFGGGKRLIRIQHAQENISASIAKFLDNMPAADSCILIEAGDLDKKSKLRQFCEAENACVTAIPCYLEDEQTRLQTISAILKQNGQSAPRDVLEYLQNALPPDRLALRSEVEKLSLYTDGKKEITLQDVKSVIHDGGAAELDELVLSAADGNKVHTIALLNRLYEEQTSTIAILRMAQRHFLRLQLVKSYIESGLAAKLALKKLQPPVFWKQEDQLARQAQKWSLPTMEKILYKLQEAECAAKKSGTPDQALCAQLLLQIANIA